MFENPVAKRTAIAAAIGAVVAVPLPFVGPILVALWARFVYREPVRRRIWLALGLALAGLTLIVQVWQGGRLSGAGLAAAAVAGVTYAAYILLAERGVRRRDPISLSAWGFFFATLFWSVLAPWWNFPAGRIGDDVSLLGNLAVCAAVAIVTLALASLAFRRVVRR